jgi:hypothetical protein
MRAYRVCSNADIFNLPEQGFDGNGSGELSDLAGCRSGCFGVASRGAGTIYPRYECNGRNRRDGTERQRPRRGWRERAWPERIEL